MSERERARARVREAGGDELLERLDHLDARAFRDERRRSRFVAPPRADDARDTDVVIGGGGLWLVLAPILAAAGLRVTVCDRARIGASHREWNAGARELEALGKLGVFAQEEIEKLTVARYANGFCRWHRGRSHPVRGVLDAAIDATGLLERARSVAESRNVTLLDGVEVVGVAGGDASVRVALRDRAGHETELTASLFVDARGAASPYSEADLACPTVGGVVRGLARGSGDPGTIDPTVGEILVTTDDVEDGRQHFWEAFPGRDGETTVYLFHYAQSSALRPGDLALLYARFFAKLGEYKRGEGELVRPTFGVIPGWSRFTRAPRPPSRRIALVGDAAARHSPLTFCGFGASVRSFASAASSIVGALQDKAILLEDPPIHVGTGALALMLAHPSRSPARAHDLNELLEAAFSTLDEMGETAYGDLLRDEMSPRAFATFLTKTAARRPRVYRDVLATIGPTKAMGWAARLAVEVARG